MRLTPMVAVLPLIVIAAGSSAVADGGPKQLDARNYAIEQIAHYCDQANYSAPVSLGVLLKIEGVSVVEGRVENVRPGKAFLLHEHAGLTPDDPSVEVDHESDRWDWAQLAVSVAGDSGGSDGEFQMAAYPSQDVDRFIAGIAALGDVVVITQPHGADGRVPGHCYRLVGLRDADGRVSFPALGDDEAAFVDGVDTVDEIRRAAS